MFSLETLLEKFPEKEIATNLPGSPRYKEVCTDRRQLLLTVPKVEVRLVRRSRTSADPILRKAHFSYVLRCEWSGRQRPDLEFGSAQDLDAQASGSAYWWDSLPNRYTLHRRWEDIVKFHNLVEQELAFDKAGGWRRVKTRVPTLPSPGDLDQFLVSVAATGDALALNRPGGLELKRGQSPQDSAALEELDILHTIYVENRLAPYFAEMTKVLAELPSSILQASPQLKLFVTSGVSCRVRTADISGLPKPRFFGPGPLVLEDSEKKAALKKLRQSNSAPQFHVKEQKGVPKVQAQKAAKASSATKSLGGLQAMPRQSLNTTFSSTAGSDNGLFSSAVGQKKNDAEATFRDSSSSFYPSESAQGLSQQDWNKQDLMPERMTQSHYGFFASKLKDVGASSSREYWKQMYVKERRALGHRFSAGKAYADLHNPDLSTQGLSRPGTSFSSRLPALPPAVDKTLENTQASRPLASRSSERLKETKAEMPKKEVATLKSEHTEVITRDLCEGFRTLVLGETVSQVPRSIRLQEPMPTHDFPKRDESMKVYRMYYKLLESEGNTPAGNINDRPSSPIPGEEQRPTPLKELARITWPTLVSWAQHLEDLAEDFRYRSVCAALIRSLDLWRRKQATAHERRFGVSLGNLIKWMWPEVTEEHIEQMMTWICMVELAKFRQPTPRVMDHSERLILEAMFQRMDSEKRGYCTAEDIAGGEEQDTSRNVMKNIVDAETVKAVVGQGRIRLIKFLELMCENGFRAHEHATQVLLDDGRKLIQQRREQVGMTMWVYEGLPPEEELARRLADVFEAEIASWHEKVEMKRRAAEAAAEAAAAAAEAAIVEADRGRRGKFRS